MIKATIDTNVLIRGLEGTPEEQERYQLLVHWHTQKIIDIGVSNRIHQDKENDKDALKTRMHLAEAAKYTEISSPFRIGVQQEHGIMGDESILSCLHALREVKYPVKKRNTLWDIDHLYGHFIANRDWFLTNEKKIWKKRPFLRQIRINVSVPEIFVTSVSKLIVNGTLSKSSLELEIEKCHPQEIDPKYAIKANAVISHYLAIEQREFEQAKFQTDARNPYTEIGSVIKVIRECLEASILSGQSEYGLILASKLYPKFVSDYKNQDTPLGDTTEGLIQWIKNIYNRSAFLG